MRVLFADDVYARISEHNEESQSANSVYSYFVDAAINQVQKDLVEKAGYSETQAFNATVQQWSEDLHDPESGHTDSFG